jgi:hypothetical protein
MVDAAHELIMRPLPITLLLLLSSSIAPLARADTPPPPGEKDVGYSFALHGLKKRPESVVFAYPCGSSSGAPQAEHRLLEDGVPVSVGRRGGECTLYTTSKARYDEWAKTYTATHAFEDPALDALAKGSSKCAGGPSPVFRVAATDPRSSVEENLDVVELGADKCEVKPRTASTDPAATAKQPDKDPSDPSTPSTPASPSSPSTTPSTGSAPSDAEGGCTVSRATDLAAPWLLALVVPAFVLGTRRRKGRS